MPQLLLATNNQGKIAEFRALLSGCGWDLVTPDDLGLKLDVHESGETYAENARIKARAFAHASQLPSLADDSGLEVDALDGEPGPLHHVRGWDGATNEERIAILLGRMEGVSGRRARFRVVIVVVFPAAGELVAEGTCDGEIALRPSGRGGFGYDPVFYLPDKGRTLAELSFEDKNRISHRARAARSIGAQLRDLEGRAPGQSNEG